MMISPVLFNGMIKTVRSKVDRSFGLSVSTGELKNSEGMAIMNLQMVNSDILVTPREDPGNSVIKVESEIGQKTKAERLRAVLFILYKHYGQKEETFQQYYDREMERIIEGKKSEIP